MFKNKNDDKNNMLGKAVTFYRLKLLPKCSQRQLADLLQLEGLDLDKNAIQRIECGKRFITDIEILAFCKVFNVTPNDLYGYATNNQEKQP
jgi:transcriptional regulator with XRE-family HTH domain